MMQFIVFSIYMTVVFYLVLSKVTSKTIKAEECPCRIKVPTLMFSLMTFAAGFFALGFPPFMVSLDQSIFLGIMIYFIGSGIMYNVNSVVGDTLYALGGFIFPVLTCYFYPLMSTQMAFLYGMSLMGTILAFSLAKFKKRYFIS